MVTNLTSPDTSMISFQQVYACYDPIKVLDDINITISESEIVTIIEANGAGKLRY